MKVATREKLIELVNACESAYRAVVEELPELGHENRAKASQLSSQLSHVAQSLDQVLHPKPVDLTNVPVLGSHTWDPSW